MCCRARQRTPGMVSCSSTLLTQALLCPAVIRFPLGTVLEAGVASIVMSDPGPLRLIHSTKHSSQLWRFGSAAKICLDYSHCSCLPQVMTKHRRSKRCCSMQILRGDTEFLLRRCGLAAYEGREYTKRRSHREGEKAAQRVGKTGSGWLVRERSWPRLLESVEGGLKGPATRTALLYLSSSRLSGTGSPPWGSMR